MGSHKDREKLWRGWELNPRPSEIFVICWIESVDPVADLCLTNQIYSVLLDAFEFKEITEVQNTHLKMLLEDGVRELADARPSNAQKCC